MIALPLWMSAIQMEARASGPVVLPEDVTADSTTVTVDSDIITADNG